VKKKFIIVFITITIIAIFYQSDYRIVYHLGIQEFHHGNNYILNEEILSDPVEFVFDWDDAKANIGKEIYDDGECKIIIDTVCTDNNGGYDIYFRTIGKYNYCGGRLVTLCSYNENSTKISDGYMETYIGNNVYINQNAFSTAKSAYKDGDEFAFHAFPLECYMNGQLLTTQLIEENGGAVQMKIHGLKEIVWERKA